MLYIEVFRVYVRAEFGLGQGSTSNPALTLSAWPALRRLSMARASKPTTPFYNS